MKLVPAAVAASAVIVSLSGQAAQAAPLVSDLLTNFNAIVGDYRSRADTEGAVLIGGNLTGSNTFDTKKQQPAAGSTVSSYGGVNVYGNTSGASYNSGGVTVDVATGNQGASFPGATKVNYNYSFPYTYSSIAAELTTLSTNLSALKTTSGSNLTNSVFTAKPVGGVAVLDLTGAQLQAISNPTFQLNGAQLFIINVDAASYSTLSGQNFNTASIGSKLLWNFYDATGKVNLNTGAVNFGVEFGGTVLAPHATVTNANAIDGMLFANAFDGSGELHYVPLSDATYLNTVGSVPEPATWAMLMVGFLGIGATAQRTGIIGRARRATA